MPFFESLLADDDVVAVELDELDEVEDTYYKDEDEFEYEIDDSKFYK
jgi:hypothetical protein